MREGKWNNWKPEKAFGRTAEMSKWGFVLTLLCVVWFDFSYLSVYDILNKFYFSW